MKILSNEEKLRISEIEIWNRLLGNPDFEIFENFINNEILVLEKRARELSKSPDLNNSVLCSAHQFAAEKLRSLLNRKAYIREQFAQLKKENLL